MILYGSENRDLPAFQVEEAEEEVREDVSGGHTLLGGSIGLDNLCHVGDVRYLTAGSA